MNFAKILKRYRIDDPDRFRLASIDPADTGGLDLDKDDAKALLEEDNERLEELQERLYAHDRWAVLVVLQGMDTAGKDGVIKHVMNGINPQGCEVHPFKAPSADELDHDFLWRAAIRLPARGDIGIFNRSYYEEVLVVRVHPEMLARQKLPEKLVGKDIWKERFKDIRAFERHLLRSGTRRAEVLPAYLQGRAAPSGCSPAWTSRPSAGSSPSATSPSASFGTSTWPPTRT